MCTIEKLKKGDLFTLVNKPNIIWIRGEYIRELKKYSIERWNTIGNEKYLKKGTIIDTELYDDDND